MKAVLCKAFGPPENLSFEEVESLKPQKGEVVIGTVAAAVNFPDLLVIQDKYQFKPKLPFSPGGEVAGVILAVGEGVTSLAVGDRVVAWAPFGCFAEEVVFPEAHVIKIPDALDLVTASTLLIAYGTTHHALVDRAHLKAGETLVVLGAAGGVGLAAIEMGRLLGARVIACASSDEKLEVCRAKGAHEVINYAREDLKERLKAIAPEGVDVIYDPVGGPYAEAALRAIGWKGRYLVIGFAAGDIPRIPLNLVLLKGCQIVGVFWGAFTTREATRYREGLAEVFEWIVQKKLVPHIDARYPLAEAPKALLAMAERKVKGKIVLVTDRAQKESNS